jgi:hypothetical protein
LHKKVNEGRKQEAGGTFLEGSSDSHQKLFPLKGEACTGLVLVRTDLNEKAFIMNGNPNSRNEASFVSNGFIFL